VSEAPCIIRSNEEEPMTLYVKGSWNGWKGDAVVTLTRRFEVEAG